MHLEDLIRKVIRETLMEEISRFIPTAPTGEGLRRFISFEEVMELTQMTRQGIFKRIREGRLKAYKPGRRLVFEESDVHQFILKNKKPHGK